MLEWTTQILTILGHSLFWLGNVVFVILVPLGLPGTWGICLLGLMFGIITGFEQLSLWGLLGMVAASTIGEIIEFFSGLAGAKYFGASNQGMWAAIVGGLLGAMFGTVLIPIPLIGSLIGAFLFSFIATVGVEYDRNRDTRQALKAGFGAFLGRAFSTIVKTSIAIGMVVWMGRELYFR